MPELYFWALQVTFAQGGRRFGGAHLGLQWHPRHPGSTAVNWGGYAAAGGELDGSTSALPSALGNPNTRDLTWEPHRPYRLAVTRDEQVGGWTGWVDDLPVRHLFAGGRELTGLMVWSEVFARCDDPPAAVRWSELSRARRARRRAPARPADRQLPGRPRRRLLEHRRAGGRRRPLRGAVDLDRPHRRGPAARFRSEDDEPRLS